MSIRCPTLSGLPSPPPDKVGWPWTEESPQLPETMPDPSAMLRAGGSTWPRVGIVTPSYNQGQFIEETIRSVLLQGYPNLEYIVMDGGSTDGTVEILGKYELFFSFLHIGPDGGQSAAIAEGFQRTTGEILAWLNSDDRYRPGALLRVARFFAAHPEVVFGNGDVNYIDAQGHVLHRIWARRPIWFLTANLGAHGWPQQGCFWRRHAYEQVGGIDTGLRFCMDRDLFIRLSKAGHSARIPGPPLADFRTHDRTKSSVLLDVAQTESQLLIARYGDPKWQRCRWLLEFGEWFWAKSASLRVRLHRWFGLEM